MKRASSLRLTLCPMPPISIATLGLPFGGLAHLARRVVDGLHDVHVTGAAAEVPGDRLADLQLGRRGVRGEEPDRGHHHSRRAEPALQAVLLMEALLDRMELPILLESLDGGDARLIRLHREQRAGLHRAAVEKDGAGAADAAAAPAAARTLSSVAWPRSVSSAFRARIAVSPTFVSPMLAAAIFPLSSSRTIAATPTIAKSPTFRSSLRYAPPLLAAGFGIRISMRIPSGRSAVVKVSRKKSSIGMTRSPLLP